jgi:hypothetical protein
VLKNQFEFRPVDLAIHPFFCSLKYIIASKSAKKTVTAEPIVAPSQASLVADAAGANFEETNLDNIHAIGNITDDRFTGGY